MVLPGGYARSVRRTALVGIVLATVAAACQVPPPPAPPPPPPPPPPSVSLVLVTSLGGAITMATRPADPTLYVATLSGHVWAVDAGTGAKAEVLDLSTVVTQAGGERGLLGMAFSPDGTRLFVHYSATGTGATVVDEYPVSGAQPGGFDGVGSRRQVLTLAQPQGNHNGGSLLFAPDGMLYLALGDGGGGNDGAPAYGSGHAVGGNAQSLDTLLGKIVRIDPTDPTPGSVGAEYSVPPDNPFVGAAGEDEIWSLGLRNPFRMSFDRATGDLWVGDVGQSAREEIDFVAAGDAVHPRGRAANFGWNRREGKVAGPGTPAVSGLTEPIFDVDRSAGDCAIIGGYVYRGSQITDLVGQYLYSDNCNGRIRALTRSGATVTNRDLGVTAGGPTSFGEDNDGNLYVLTFGGVYRIGPP
jgi:glucose/arabinose dehydrogenase